ncbi:MAG: DJ-1/PfpI family protein [Candidatus Aenigmatarchaeota archaeon]
MINLSSKSVLMVIAPEDFRDEELQEPKDILTEYGAKVTVASKETDSATGMLGATVMVDKHLAEVDPKDYDAVIFVGGTGASVYFKDVVAKNLAKDAYQEGKIVGAICIAPSILANAGLLEDKIATSYSSQEGNLRDKGANYTGAGVEVDGKIVTGKGPKVASDFGQKVAEVLSKKG